MNHQSEDDLTSAVRAALLFVGELVRHRGDSDLPKGELEAVMTGERPLTASTARVVEAALGFLVMDIECCQKDIREALADLPPSERAGRA